MTTFQPGARIPKRSGGGRGRTGPTSMDELIGMLVTEGCQVDRGKKGHPVVTTPDGRRTTIPATPRSEYRAVRNTSARLRRDYGLTLRR